MTLRRSDALKICFRCEVVKPRSEFYAHPQMGDGLLGKCKTCARADVRENRLMRADHYRDYDRTRAHRRRRDPAKEKARKAIHDAVCAGRIVKPTHCEDCGTGPLFGRAIQGHHEDYGKPLDVIWVCTACHGLRHGSDVLSRLHQVIHFRFQEAS